MSRSTQAWPKYIFWAVLLDFGEGGLELLGSKKWYFGQHFPFIMSYPSARRMGRALSALALPYKMGGSMGSPGRLGLADWRRWAVEFVSAV